MVINVSFRYSCEYFRTDYVLHFQELLDIDGTKTGQVLLQHVPQLVPRIVGILQEEPRVLFQFLQGLFDCRWVWWKWLLCLLLNDIWTVHLYSFLQNFLLYLTLEIEMCPSVLCELCCLSDLLS
jgi:hypothetical protein